MKNILIGVGVCCLCLAGAWAYQFAKKEKEKKEKYPASYFKKTMADEKGDNLLFGKIGDEEIGIAVSNSYNANVLVCGDTGSGKNFNYMLPNLMNGNFSVVIYEPTNCTAPVSVLKEKGYEIVELTDDSFAEEGIQETILKARQQKTALILNVSDMNFSYAVEKIFGTLMKKPEGNHVIFWIDEICNTPEIKELKNMLIFARKSNASFQLITQSIRAFECKYTENIEPFELLLANIGTFLIAGTPSHDNAEYFAEKIMNDKNYQLPEVKPSQTLVNAYGHVAVCEKLNPADYR